jgi:hypothetical protein
MATTQKTRGMHFKRKMRKGMLIISYFASIHVETNASLCSPSCAFNSRHGNCWEFNFEGWLLEIGTNFKDDVSSNSCEKYFRSKCVNNSTPNAMLQSIVVTCSCFNVNDDVASIPHSSKGVDALGTPYFPHVL